jgi:hypothetical protein
MDTPEARAAYDEFVVIFYYYLTFQQSDSNLTHTDIHNLSLSLSLSLFILQKTRVNEKHLLVFLHIFSDATVTNAQTDACVHNMYASLSAHSAERRAKMESICIIGGVSTKIGDRTQNLSQLLAMLIASLEDL